MAKGRISNAGNVITQKVRFNFPKVIRPEKNDKGELVYGVTLLYPLGADISVEQQQAFECVVAKYGADQSKWPRPFHLPFRDQGEKAGKEGYVPGAIFITARSDYKPGVVDGNNFPIEDEAQVYSGCYGHASIRAFCYEYMGKKGVSFALVNLQKTEDGEPLSGKAKAEDEFTPIAGAGGSGTGSPADLFGAFGFPTHRS